MNRASWSRVKITKRALFDELVKVFPRYEYSTLQMCSATDDKICEYFINKLSEAKRKAFHLLQNSYELHYEDLVPKFDHLRLDIDIFSDEIKMRYTNFKKITEEFMEELMQHDLEIVRSLDVFLLQLDDTHDKLIATYKPIDVKELRRSLANIVILFKERELITNLKHVSLKRTYNRMRVEIKEKIGVD